MPVSFTDRDLGKLFPNGLCDAGLMVERHADHFRHDCPDTDWLRDVGKRGWIAITHDRRIRYKPNEKEAVRQHKVALLVIVGHMSHAELARGFINTQARILRFIEQNKPPYIAKVYRPSPGDLEKNPNAPGRVELWWRP